MIKKTTALEVFKEELQHAIKNNVIAKGDKPAIREAWNNYTDMLRKDNMITDKQYNTWSQPFA